MNRDGRDPLEDDKELPNGEHEAEDNAELEEPEDDVEDPDEGSADELGEDGQDEEVDTAPRRPSRAEGRIARLAREAREAKEEAAETRRQLQQMQQDMQRRQAAAQEREPTDDEMSLWTPQQVMDHKLGKATRQTNAQLAQLQFQMVNTGDKAAFVALQSADPLAKRYAAEVERRHAELVSQGQFVEREKLLRYVIGDAMYTRRRGAVEKQRGEGQRRIARERAPLANGRGDVARGREKLSDSAAREKRLENFTF